MLHIPDPNDLIMAPATAPGRSAIGVIRVSGRGCVDLLSQGFSRPQALRDAGTHQLVHGRLQHHGEVVDEVLVAVFRGSHGYTGEEAAEISFHGSPVIQVRLMALLLDLGFREAIAGEFTLRAVINGRMDLTQAEAVRELIDARTAAGSRAALDRLSGRTRDRLRELRGRLLQVAAAVSVELDYPDDEVDTGVDHRAAILGIHEDVAQLLAGYRYGQLLQNGASVVIAGAPNAGKSSLFNAVLGEERAMVSDIPGTTRDFLERVLDLDGLPVQFIDTAGLRPSDDPLEREGTRRAGALLAAADLVLAVVDAADPAAVAAFSPENSLPAAAGTPRLLVWNKTDMPGAAPPPEGAIPLSARTGFGVSALLDRIRATLLDGSPPELSIASERQQRELTGVQSALAEAIAAMDEGMPLDALSLYVADALAGIGALTGEIRSDEVLDLVFSGFCVGK